MYFYFSKLDQHYCLNRGIEFYRDGSRSENLGGQVVMRCLLFCNCPAALPAIDAPDLQSGFSMLQWKQQTSACLLPFQPCSALQYAIMWRCDGRNIDGLGCSVAVAAWQPLSRRGLNGLNGLSRCAAGYGAIGAIRFPLYIFTTFLLWWWWCRRSYYAYLVSFQ